MQVPSQILIATGNKGKFEEISALLKEVNIEAIPASKFNLVEPEENGKSFEQNSLIKAKYYASKTNLFALADDSGLCIKDLDNKPGIHSARFAINDKTQEKDFPHAFEKIFLSLKEKNITSQDKPKAYFICNLTIFDPKNNFHISFEGRVDGHLIYPPQGDLGFGYDPIFMKDGMDKTFGEIERFQKDKISHRGLAFNNMMNWIKNNQQTL